MISLLPMIPLVYFGIRLSIIDLKTHRLPNQLVGWFVLIENAILVAFSLSTDDLFQLITALGVAVATTTIYLLLYLLSRGSLGMGDVKFAFPLGLCIGWYSADLWLLAIFVSFLLAGLVAFIGLATKRMTRKSRLAFGPYMFLGTSMVCGLAVFSQ
jgi:leader peptidase (prepilin peptidase) / N-methyltransferase